MRNASILKRMQRHTLPTVTRSVNSIEMVSFCANHYKHILSVHKSVPNFKAKVVFFGSHTPYYRVYISLAHSIFKFTEFHLESIFSCCCFVSIAFLSTSFSINRIVSIFFVAPSFAIRSAGNNQKVNTNFKYIAHIRIAISDLELFFFFISHFIL